MSATQLEIHDNAPLVPTMTPNDTDDPVIIIQPSDPETQSTSDLSSEMLMLPIPTHLTNQSQSSFALSELIDETDLVPSELADADISFASDRSYVETSSAQAAQKLKKYWDQKLGVGKEVRSPYAITAFVNQHGKQMFRVSRRELSAPLAASSADMNEQVSSSVASPSEPSTSSRVKRRSRISVHNIPTISIFNKNPSSSKVHAIQPSAPRKLRKTRSIPDLCTNDATAAQGPPALGRLHSRSVTAADVSPFSTVVRNPNTIDLFGQLMEWHPPPSTSGSISSNSLTSDEFTYESHDEFKSPIINALPFGLGVSYDSPARKTSFSDLLPPPIPRHLREVQSFESGLTARQIDPPPARRTGRDSFLTMETYVDDPDINRPPSALRIRPPSSPLQAHDMTPKPASPEPNLTGETDSVSEPAFEPESISDSLLDSPSEPASERPKLVPQSPAEPILLSRYSPEIFDVLQNFRGLPLLDKLISEMEPTTVIKLSLSADDSAAPRDDPRFVIWGEIFPDRDADDQSVEHESATDFSAPSSSLSRRRASKAKAVEAPTLQLPARETQETQRVIIAATIERWIAQLTSDLNYDELLDFFLTYRTYVSSVDLLHLLISRFHWSLQQPPSARDQHVRSVVRVRTFVAIRYWLLTFFTVDFIPNRELRLLTADWLNSLVRDPILRQHKDGLGIVRKLIKVAKECKQAHTRLPVKLSSRPRTSISSVSTETHVLGAKFAAATRKPKSDDDDSDVDLDFLPDEGSLPLDAPLPDHANAHLSTLSGNTLVGVSSNRASSIPFSFLQRSDHPSVSNAPTDMQYTQTPAALPTHRSVVSRVIGKTIGRLGRWKRTLNARSYHHRSANTGSVEVSAFDLEPTGAQELLGVNGAGRLLKVSGSEGLELAKTVEVAVPLSPGPTRTSTSLILAAQEVDKTCQVIPAMAVIEPTNSPEPEPVGQTGLESPPDYTESGAQPQSPPGLTPASWQPVAGPSTDSLSIRSSTSTDSFGEPLTTAPTFPRLAQSQWQFDVISIDDLDLSDSSSDHNEAGPSAPPGLKRLPKKLPMRRDFEFVRRDTVSSMGLSRDSIISGPSSHDSSAQSAIGLGGAVAQWQLNALVDSLSDEEERGDVEDALRRLEGQINPQKQREKASKVDGWVRTIQERLAAGDYTDEQPPFLDDSDEEDYGDGPNDLGSDSFDQDSASVRNDTASVNGVGDSSVEEEGVEMVITPIPTQVTHVILDLPGTTSPPRSTDAKPVVEEAVPLEIIQGRLPSRPSTASSSRAPPSQTVKPRDAFHYQSFLLGYRSSELAENFAMIDKELFINVKFEELVLEEWIKCKEVDVLDWVQYLKDRARWKVEHRYSEKTSGLAAVRARFNLMAHFTISEVVQTSPHERHLVVSKLIRIAWKAYLLCNYSTLIAIIMGLDSDWVTRATRRTANGWSRVSTQENRMFRDLKGFTTLVDDFKYIRQAITAIIDAKTMDVNSQAASVVSTGGTDVQSGKGKASADRYALPSACIPFIGVYLSELQRHSRLPDLIDPTAPEEVVDVDPHTSSIEAPAHPEVFSTLPPLPPSVHLEPLINVHKQRRIAGVIKALVAGQHLASRVHFDVDKKLFQKCLKVRAVNADTLQRILSVSD